MDRSKANRRRDGCPRPPSRLTIEVVNCRSVIQGPRHDPDDLLAIAASAAIVIPAGSAGRRRRLGRPDRRTSPSTPGARRPAAWYEAGDAQARLQGPQDSWSRSRAAGVIINGQSRPDAEPAQHDRIRRHRGPLRVHDPQGLELGRQVRGPLRDPDLRQPRRRQARPPAIAAASIPAPSCCPKYHYLDEGIPPRVNAARPPASGRRSTSSSVPPGSTRTARRRPTPASTRWSSTARSSTRTSRSRPRPATPGTTRKSPSGPHPPPGRSRSGRLSQHPRPTASTDRSGSMKRSAHNRGDHPAAAGPAAGGTPTGSRA